MSDLYTYLLHSAACNPLRHIRQRYSTIKRVLYIIPPQIDDVQGHTTPPVKKLAPLTTRTRSLRCVLAAEHHTAEQYSITGRTKLQKHLPRSKLSWKTCQHFLKILCLWEAALETERRCFSKVILESNVTPNCQQGHQTLAAQFRQ